jgi:hypothetical protein
MVIESIETHQVHVLVAVDTKTFNDIVWDGLMIITWFFICGLVILREKKLTTLYA